MIEEKIESNMTWTIEIKPCLKARMMREELEPQPPRTGLGALFKANRP